MGVYDLHFTYKFVSVSFLNNVVSSLLFPVSVTSTSRIALEKLNSYHSNIQFTPEIEENQKITFLDVLITRT